MMETISGYISGLGASVMMPALFALLGLCAGVKPAAALRCGLKVGVGFVGLSIVTALLTSALGPELETMAELYGLRHDVFDMGWPAAASIACDTAVGLLIIPLCAAVNVLMLLTRTTRTVNIDFWNYWHFAFIGAVIYFACGSMAWGFFGAVVCFVVTMVIADLTAPGFQRYYKGMEGISIPHPFCAGFAPVAWAVGKGLDRVPRSGRLEFDPAAITRRFGRMGEPLLLGVAAGVLAGCLACSTWTEILNETPRILSLGIKMGAVMELIPRVTALFSEGLKPISDAARAVITRRFGDAGNLSIGMSPAVVIAHPSNVAASLPLIPAILILAVVLPGNRFLPIASIAGVFYIFPLMLPFTKGSVAKALIAGIIAIGAGLYMVTDMAPAFSVATANVSALTSDAAAAVPEGFQGGSLDFGASPLAWAIYLCAANLRYLGAGILVLASCALMWWNRRRILRDTPLPSTTRLPDIPKRV